MKMSIMRGMPCRWNDATRPTNGKPGASYPIIRCALAQHNSCYPSRVEAAARLSKLGSWSYSGEPGKGRTGQSGQQSRVASGAAQRQGVCSTAEEEGAGGRCEPLPRRSVLLRSLALPAVLASLTTGSDDPTTLLNSVLAGYGLPKLPGSTGFKLLDDFELEFTLEYPRSWVVRPNSLRQGVIISDFNTADKLSVEVFALTPGSDLVMAAVAAAVVPGAGAGQQDDKLLLPPANRVKSRVEQVEGKEYTYLEFPSETITRSGYQILRKNFAVAAVKRDMAYTLNASSRSDQYNKDKEALLRHVVQSFRVR